MEVREVVPDNHSNLLCQRNHSAAEEPAQRLARKLHINHVVYPHGFVTVPRSPPIFSGSAWSLVARSNIGAGSPWPIESAIGAQQQSMGEGIIVYRVAEVFHHQMAA